MVLRRTKGSASKMLTRPSSEAERRLRGKERVEGVKKERAVVVEEEEWCGVRVAISVEEGRS